MRSIGKGTIALFGAVLAFSPSALAASPEDIYKDLADNGRLDVTYTQAELQAFLQNASVQGYGNPVVPPVVVPPVVVPPVVTPPEVPPAVVTPPGVTPPAGEAVATPAAPASGVAGTSKTIVNAKPRPATGVAGVATPTQAPLARTATAGTLPFTGAELGLFAIVGAALLFGGLLLRASARQR